MAQHIRRLCIAVGSRFSNSSVDSFLKLRNISERKSVLQLQCDGYIEPCGQSFSDGFRMVVREDVAATRMGFTLAHELCHTFFYELVPEIKFSAHQVDQREEQVCNYGSACLLMPEDDVLSRIKDLPLGIASLEEITTAFGVSLDTAVLRLRSLRLWDCEFSVWHRLTTGECALSRLYGYQREEWRWSNEELLKPLWDDEDGSIRTGRTFVEYEIPNAHPAAKPVFYQAKRRGNSVIALWKAGRFPQPTLPLLDMAKRKSKAQS